MTDLALISTEDLKNFLREIIAEQHTNEPTGDWMNVHEFSEYISHSVHWTYQRLSRAKRGLPTSLPPIHRQGAKVLFKKSEVNNWLEKRES
jgi:predicted DNA-binding transcriptional regulator AlpA